MSQEIEEYEPRLVSLVGTANMPEIKERHAYEKFRTDGSLSERGVVERYA